MARRPLSENLDTARSSAWRQLGREYKWWFIGGTVAKIVVPPLAFAALVLFVGVKIWRALSTDGPNISAPAAPVFGGVLPWMVFAISATGGCALLLAWWWNPVRRNRGLLLVGAFVLFGLCVAIAAWMRG